MTEYDEGDIITAKTDDRGRWYLSTDMANKKITGEILRVVDLDETEDDE